MTAHSLIAIHRETLHSPQRVFDDFEILRLTGEVLRSEGVEVEFVRPDQIASSAAWWNETRPEIVFLMCEQERLLRRLAEWERRGSILINSVEAIRNTYRNRMIPLLSASAVLFPRSELIATVTSLWEKQLQSLFRNGMGPLWVKRGDVHNTQKGDVTLARSPEEVRGLILAFQSRGVAQAALQEHIEGDLIKLYGIGQSGDAWFRWFYHKEQRLKHHAFSEQVLRDTFFCAAKVLDLEVFGGDAVVAPDGSVHLIDINAWPSFALFREEASEAIARHILSKISDPVS
ncbi:MAG: hypothetical protein WCE49_10740 [Terrimicrobiaceae bacterium]